MDTKFYSHVSYSRVSETGLRFTNAPDDRPAGLPDDQQIRFFPLPVPMTKLQAAQWLREQAFCNTPDWQDAIARQLGELPKLPLAG